MAASTSTTLQQGDQVRLGFVLVIEGTPLVYTTIADTSAISTAWAGTDWAGETWRGGLGLPGALEQKIELFQPKLDVSSMSFRIADDSANGIYTLISPANSSVTKTFLTTSVDCDDTSLVGLDTSGFAGSGTIYIGNETIAYTTNSSNTFGGLTRGKYALWQTNGSSDWTTPHRIDGDTSARPIISDAPRHSYNRGVALYMHHFEDGIWSTRANAVLMWAGRIKDLEDLGDGSFVLHCMSVSEKLRAMLLADQFVGVVPPGKYIDSTNWVIRATEWQVDGTPNNDETSALFASASRRTHVEVSRAIADLLRSSGTIGTNLTWIWSFVLHEGKYRMRCFLDAAPTSYTQITLWLTPEVWGLLGYDSISGSTYIDPGTGVSLKGLKMSPTDTTRIEWVRDADYAPVAYYPAIGEGATITLDAAAGTFETQPQLPAELGLPSDTDGFLQVGDLKVVAVRQVSSTQYTIIRDVSQALASKGLRLTVPDSDQTIAVIREGEGSGAIEAKQVWWEQDEKENVILRALLSTGTNAFNHATYDVNPEGMGLAVPASLVDITSFQNFSNGSMTLFLDKATGFEKLFISMLAVAGKHLIWRDGKLTLDEPRIDGTAITAAWALTESNRAGQNERSKIKYTTNGLINRLVLEYDPDITGKLRRTIEARNSPSITDFGQRRTLTTKGLSVGLADVREWTSTAASALALFSQPITVVTRSYNQTLIEMVPTDTVTVTDNHLLDPSAKTRGATTIPGWVTSTSFDFRTMRGEAEISLLVDVDTSRIGPWAPSAKVDETYTAGLYTAGYDSTNFVLTTKPSAFSDSSETFDGNHFAAGDIIDIVEYSPATPASPTRWQRTISSVDPGPGSNVDISLTSGLSSPAFDSSLEYVITHADIAGVVQAQKAESFIADDADNSTGDATNDAYLYGGVAQPVNDLTTTSTNRFKRIPDTVDDAGEPFAVHIYHDLVESLNNMLEYAFHNERSDMFDADRQVTGTSFTLVYGPIWMPIYNLGRRTMKVIAYGYTDASTTATVRVYASQSKVLGASDTTTSYSAEVTSVDITMTNTTADYSSAGSLATVPINEGSPHGVWLTAELKCSTGGGTATLRGLTFYEGTI